MFVNVVPGKNTTSPHYRRIFITVNNREGVNTVLGYNFPCAYRILYVVDVCLLIRAVVVCLVLLWTIRGCGKGAMLWKCRLPRHYRLYPQGQ